MALDIVLVTDNIRPRTREGLRIENWIRPS